MGMLQDTVRNLKKLATATKAADTPPNVGVAYTINHATLLVTGTFAVQLAQVMDDDAHDFSYDVIDFVMAPVSFSLTNIKPTSNFTVTYDLSDVWSEVIAANKPSWVILPAGATNANDWIQAVTLNDSYFVIGVSETGVSSTLEVQLNNLPVGLYKLSVIPDSDVTNLPLIKSFPFEVTAV